MRVTVRRLVVVATVVIHYAVLFSLWVTLKTQTRPQPSHPQGQGHPGSPRGQSVEKAPSHLTTPPNKRNATLRILHPLRTTTLRQRPTRLTKPSPRPRRRRPPPPPTKTTTTTTTKPTPKPPPTVRPFRCNGCFNTTFPILMDQPHACQSHRNKDNNSSSSPNSPIEVVFLITSAVTHFQRRHAIRETWASVTRNNTAGGARHVFMVGDTPNVRHRQAARLEGDKYRDVVMHGFRDSYMNLTLKTVTSLRWVAHRCKQARFFMKVDDDVWINTPTVLNVLKNHSSFLQHGVGGHCPDNHYPNRSNKSKWYVPEQLFPKKKYAPYCVGFAYVGDVKVAQKVVDVSPDVPFFYLEDVYVGMCLERLGYQVRTFPGFRNFLSKVPCNRARSPGVGTILDAPPGKMYEFWKGRCGKG